MRDEESLSGEGVISREEKIFCDALQISNDAERDVFLRQACGTSGTLRAAVDELLSSYSRADGFFRASSAVLKPPTEFTSTTASGASNLEANAGMQLGPYKLLHPIGDGGSGVVYLASQEHPVRRPVAIKLLKLGMDTKRVMARFDAERQTLAMVEHPNIAHVLDAGATETGRPYFVMELVRGQHITEYCASKSVGLIERLRLFQQVCQAVQHAHQKGIIHRDLKPSNILVALHDEIPVPKVIDFGIAKVIGGAASQAESTLCDRLIGTPAYMSPEQVQGGWVDIDTRSDIYSLGVVLYELLVGRPPLRNEELLRAGVDEMRRRVLTEESLPPSLLASRGHDLAPVTRQWLDALRGDLDWIVIKALEKDRNRRYQTVRGLWLDIERYLTNEPVEARPPSQLYRLQKLIRRNKVLFAAIGSATVALIAGFTIATWLYFKAAAAEQQQTSLRTVAEKALEQEAILRRQAEDRERIAHAAILLLERRFAEADTLVRQMPGPLRQPSVEASNVFRELAEWNVIQGDLPTAAERTLSLLEVNRFDESDQTHVVTRDLVVTAPTLIGAGELEIYEKLRTDWVRKFSQTRNPVAAEQVMKTCLLRPPNRDLLKALEPLAQTLEECIGDRTASILDRAWGSIALGLLEYRRASYAEGAEWSARSRAFAYRNKAHQAFCLVVEAMCRWEQGEADPAREALGQAQQLIEGWFARPARGAEIGAWNDWLIARILLREARQRMDLAGDF